MSKAFRKIMASGPMLSLLYGLIRGYSWTFRLQVENEHLWKDHWDAGGAVVFCCWHQQVFTVRHFKRYGSCRPSVMISRSYDGDIGAGIAARLGWEAVRGSSTRGGREALVEMVERIKATRMAGLVVDGPRGPAGKVKPGIIRLAQLGGAAIVPFYVRADRAWYLNSWDRFMVPKPFARVRLTFGGLHSVPETTTPEEFEHHREMLENAMLPGLIRP